MITKQLFEIGWDDILALIRVEREEDDTIEFKSGFSSGADFTVFNDKAQREAVDTLLSEVLAFLNTRGGDLVIGIAEAPDRAVAAAATPVPNVSEVADRLARSFAALIEPAQTSVHLRAIVDPGDPTQGLIVIRVQASLRAPHRSKRTRQCYVRRGNESVPMAMDEIQELTVYRTELRRERQTLLTEQFSDFVIGRSEHRSLPPPIFHVRLVYLPFVDLSLEIGDPELRCLSRRECTYFRADGTQLQNNVALGPLIGGWKPMLRGRRNDSFVVRSDDAGLKLASVRLKSRGILTHEFATQYRSKSGVATVHWSWLLGFFAQAAKQLEQLLKIHPSLLPGTLRAGIRSEGDVNLAVGEGFFEEAYALPNDTLFLPDYPLETSSDLSNYFLQVQTDVMSLVGEILDEPLLLHKQEASETPTD